jgi:putative SOS response-associated peptidase YedK
VWVPTASPFGIGGLWENWKEPTSGKWIRTFAIITTDANELVAEIHDRMPLIIAPPNYERWLGDEPDPHDLMRPFPPSRCECGRSRRGSTSRRTTTPRSLSRSNYLLRDGAELFAGEVGLRVNWQRHRLALRPGVHSLAI